MKKIYSIFAVMALMATALCFSSCDGVPAQGDVQQVTVVGTWQCVSADFGSLSEDAVGMINEGDKITLKDDGTYYLDSKKLKQSGTWSKNDKTLKIVSPDMTLNFNITELTSAKLSCYLYIYGHTLKFTFARV
jgi:hypothetical protein